MSMHLNSLYIRKYNLYVFLLLLIYIFFYSISVVFFSDYLSNTVFVDGVNWYEFIISIVSGEVLFSDVRASWGGLAFYTVFYLLGGVYAIILVNFVVVLYSMTKVSFSMTLPVIFLPFYLLCMLLPSKDILVLLLTIVFFLSIFNKQFKIALLLSLLIFLVRDAYGIVAFGLTALFYMNWNTKFLLWLILIFCFLMDYFLNLYRRLYRIIHF